jgi:DNA-binding response OmpR family regulator
VTIERMTASGRQPIPISLSALDFHLLYLLAARYLEMNNFEAQARGWVSSSELLDSRLPFGTKTPTSNNLRGAIKRIRDKFRNHGVEPVIESQQNVGYRLNPAYGKILL